MARHVFVVLLIRDAADYLAVADLPVYRRAAATPPSGAHGSRMVDARCGVPPVFYLAISAALTSRACSKRSSSARKVLCAQRRQMALCSARRACEAAARAKPRLSDARRQLSVDQRSDREELAVLPERTFFCVRRLP